MGHLVEDYYDMSFELLPRANFAGCPTSDISMPYIKSDVQSRRLPKRDDNPDDVGSAGRQRIYLPGAIVLEQHPDILRKDSVAGMNPSAIDPDLDSKGNSISDMMGRESLVVFFEDFVVAQVTEATLDQYWLRESRNSHNDDYDGNCDDVVDVFDIAATQKPSVSNEEATVPKARCGYEGPHESKFLFSSASRNRLREMLSPGLPGSFKSPASK
ncbi:hypothetical protein EJ02DRAFT_450710 [Clathrospora elynae]|uniref:Uncharacterized protein n=1 Tax=Clathrospora elynae TaxID=706981 RepID=A0A6A5T0X4_9PLEO|nr:hypothetical protein EJ02DRAFT_450710 [Clathrospora elynae]